MADDDELLKKYAKRLGVHEAETLKKSTELFRLIELKNLANASQSTKIVLCLESASMLCGSAFDHTDDAIKFSGVNKKEYARQKKVFDTLLGLKRHLPLSDICLQLELPQAIQTNAQRLLNAYKNSAKFTDNIQSAHCLAMAVYQCCKHKKMKLSKIKKKLTTLSNLDGSQWKRLEEQWDKWILTTKPFNEKSVPVNGHSELNQNDEQCPANATQMTVPKEDKTQSYEEWKAEMIARAMAEFKKQNNTSQNEITIE